MYLDSKCSQIILSYHLCLVPTNVPVARSTFQTWNPKVRKVGPQRRWDSFTIFPKSWLVRWSSCGRTQTLVNRQTSPLIDFDSRIANNQPVMGPSSREKHLRYIQLRSLSGPKHPAGQPPSQSIHMPLCQDTCCWILGNFVECPARNSYRPVGQGFKPIYLRLRLWKRGDVTQSSFDP